MTNQSQQIEPPEVGFWKVAPKRGNLLGILDPTGEQLTFDELFGRINQVSHYFRHIGVIGFACYLDDQSELPLLCLEVWENFVCE